MVGIRLASQVPEMLGSRDASENLLEKIRSPTLQRHISPRARQNESLETRDNKVVGYPSLAEDMCFQLERRRMPRGERE